MRVVRLGWLMFCFGVAAVLPLLAQDSRGPGSPSPLVDTGAPSALSIAPHPTPSSFDDVVDRLIEREHQLQAQMRNMRPMVETYLQNLKTDENGVTIPIKDEYFLGRLDTSDGPEDVSFVSQSGGRSRLSRLTGIYEARFEPLGFAQMVVPDTDLYKKYYTFNYVRREFLGEVRCIAIDVQPKKDAPMGRFQGRIWVEDQGYNIVRFNGTFSGHPRNAFYLHFDSWRLNLRAGMWLPAYVYSEQSEGENGGGHLHMKAQTRLWGYDLRNVTHNNNDEFTQIMVDPREEALIKDRTGAASDAAPVMAERMWERQAEDNVVERLQKVGLMAPPGDVDKVM